MLLYVQKCKSNEITGFLRECKDVIILNARMCLQQPGLYQFQDFASQFINLCLEEDMGCAGWSVQNWIFFSSCNCCFLLKTKVCNSGHLRQYEIPRICIQWNNTDLTYSLFASWSSDRDASAISTICSVSDFHWSWSCASDRRYFKSSVDFSNNTIY